MVVGRNEGGPDVDDLMLTLQRVPELAGRELSCTPLAGGITNRNLCVSAEGSEDRWVVRLPGTDTHLLGIDRDVELAASQMADGIGVGPGVAGWIQPEGYLVTRFIEGASVTTEDIHRPTTLRRLGETLRAIHDGPAIPGRFDPFRIVEAYRRLAGDRGVPIPSDYDPAAEIARRIEQALASDPLELRPCHNDLLNSNLIDDGSRIRVIDWEYAGMGDPYFDLGNVSVNHDLTPAEDRILLAAHDGDVRPKRLARLTLMRVVSDFREAMWGVLQQGISALDTDFAGYAAGEFRAPAAQRGRARVRGGARRGRRLVRFAPVRRQAALLLIGFVATLILLVGVQGLLWPYGSGRGRRGARTRPVPRVRHPAARDDRAERQRRRRATRS